MNLSHTLKEYMDAFTVEGILVKATCADEDAPVAAVSYDSQEVIEKTLFFCKGVHFKSQYLADSLEKGALGYVAEKEYEDVNAANFIVVSDIRRAMAIAANMCYNQVWKDITTIGLTGTKGKSTTAFYMKYILDDYEKENGKPETAVLSSVDNYDGVIREESHLTTPEAFVLHKHFDNAVKSGIEFFTMEVSSQGLKYDRTRGIIYDVGILLNIGEDHISPIEHPSVEDYVDSKMKLFEQCRIAVINLNSAFAERAIETAKGSKVLEKIITYGTDERADLMSYDVQPSRKGITFMAKCDSFDEEFKIGMPGIFNVDNAMAAISICYALNIPMHNIKKGLLEARVNGRMEVFVSSDERKTVIVDYAHNVMSYTALFDSVEKEYPEAEVTIVFGCPGGKGIARRKELGTIAGLRADRIIITEEDPGEEDPLTISLEVEKHVRAAGGDNCEIIIDREEACRRAIEESDPDGVILLLAKGRETRQKRGLEYVETESDVDFALRYLE